MSDVRFMKKNGHIVPAHGSDKPKSPGKIKKPAISEQKLVKKSKSGI